MKKFLLIAFGIFGLAAIGCGDSGASTDSIAGAEDYFLAPVIVPSYHVDDDGNVYVNGRPANEQPAPEPAPASQSCGGWGNYC